MPDLLRSPIFPEESLTLTSALESEGGDALVPQLPETAVVKNSSLEIYIVPTESTIFVQGFKPVEYELRPPSLLRGSLVVRVLRPTKIKSITLNFKGHMQTDWPEGIPPKRNVYEETSDLMQHSWPFYQLDANHSSHGAHIHVANSKVNLEEYFHSSNDAGSSQLGTAVSTNPLESASTFAASLIRRATSPLGGGLLSPSLTPVTSNDLQSIISPGSELKQGCFAPGDYVYNFEHLIPALAPESTRVTFGSVDYFLEAVVARQGTFKPVLRGKLPINIVRVPMDNSVEENEPIVIERDWEDFLRYEIVVASKSVVLDSYLPMSLKFIPLNGKVALHRIRVFIIEECNYYCQNKKVHRSEPSRKFLLLEHKASKSQSLLNKDGKPVDDSPNSTTEVLPRDLEFQMFVPYTINKKFNFQIHPDSAVENIQCTHWIKICLRLSKPNPENGGKRKHFEISIDSPIHLYSPLAAHNNTLLPIYEKESEFLPQYAEDAPLSPEVTAIDATHSHTSLNFQGSSCSLQSMAIPRVPSAISFQHIVSPTNIGYAEMDNDLHLDSNLYKPEDEAIFTKILAAQAVAYSPLASPVRSPSSRTLAPTTSPPLFNSLGMTENTLPPAYGYHNNALSQSPLKLDVQSDPTNAMAVSAQSIRNKLSEQLLKGLRKSNTSCQSSFNSDSSSSKSKDRKMESNSSSDLSTERSSDELNHNDVKMEPAPANAAFDERRSSQDASIKPNIPTLSSNADTTLNEEPSSTFVPNLNDTVDIADIAETADITSKSRRSSIALSLYLKTGLSELLIHQTLPLLAQSTTSVYDPESRVNDFAMESVTDLVGVRFDDFRLDESLSHLRNPRLEKHYQEVASTGDIDVEGQNRARGFGVVMK